jgi:hypothetical protein
MKQKIILFVILAGSFAIIPKKTNAQAYEIEQLILDWEKLAQLKNILKDLYKGYEILSQGYNTIKDISEGNFNLHKVFLDGLLLVSPAVKNYNHVAGIIDYQSRLVSEYKAAFSHFSRDKHFTPDEIVYLGQVYGNLFNESLKDIDNLINVITASKLRMSDDERLQAIDEIYVDSKDKLMFLRQFNSSTAVLAVQREADLNDVGTLKKMHGLQ